MPSVFLNRSPFGVLPQSAKPFKTEKLVPVDEIENAVPLPSGPPLDVKPVKTSCAFAVCFINRKENIIITVAVNRGLIKLRIKTF